jgi:hypothetical protein
LLKRTQAISFSTGSIQLKRKQLLSYLASIGLTTKELTMLQTHHSIVFSKLPDFAPVEIDCATAVMLKILDRKCKMKRDEKQLMEALYDAIKDRPGKLLPACLHEMIASAREQMDETLREEIYAQRLYAETMISRPIMKQFKARLRRTGILEANPDC